MGAPGKRLQVSTPSDREIVMTRDFDAPRDLVFEAHTSCEHMRNWWGPRRYEIADCEIDFRPGGSWRIVHRAEGEELVFRGEYREIDPPDRITWTFEWLGAPGQVAVETVTLDEADGKTMMTVRSEYPSREARDAVLDSGMEEGAAETWDRLEEYVGTLNTSAET